MLHGLSQPLSHSDTKHIYGTRQDRIPTISYDIVRLNHQYVGYAPANLPTYLLVTEFFLPNLHKLPQGRHDRTYNIVAIHPVSMAALRNFSTDSLLNHMAKTPQKHGVSANGTIAKTSTASTRPISVLFVCLGNICRSPMAEGVFRSLTASDQRLGQIDSCGTGAYRAYHCG